MAALLHKLIFTGIHKKTTRLEFFIIKNSNIIVLFLIPLVLIMFFIGVLGAGILSNYILLFIVILFWSSTILFSNYKENAKLLKHTLYVGLVVIILLCSFYIGFNVGFNLFFIVISIIPFVLFHHKLVQYGYFIIALLAFLFSLGYSYFELNLMKQQVFYIFLSNSLLAFAIQLLNSFLFKTKLNDYAQSALLHKNELALFSDFFSKRLKEKTKHLVKENDKLMDINHAAKSYAYHVSHDLKEPLKNIISFISITEKKLAEVEDIHLKEELSYYNKFVRNAAKRLEVFVSEVLRFSLLENDNAIPFESVDMNKSVQNVILSLTGLINKAKVDISYDLPSKIRVNPVQIEALFQNLISNSIKYKLSNKAPSIYIRYRELDHHFEFIYTDNGRGIPKNEKELVFEAFKVSSFNKKTDNSTGLGLSICKRILNYHQGDIWIQSSKKNQGAKFIFTIKKNLGEDTEQSNMAA